MALTTLDAKTALIVIDLQRGIVALPVVHPASEIVQRSVAVLDAFRRHGLPVVLANVALSTRKSMSACWPPSGTVKTLIWVTIGVFASMFGTSRSSMFVALRRVAGRA